MAAAPSIEQAARREAHESRLALVEAGNLLPAARAAAALGLTEAQLAAETDAGRLLALPVEGRGLYWPAFPADPALDRAQLAAVLQALAQLTPWGRYRFLTQGKGFLSGATPLMALRGGCHGAVVSAKAASER